jgi:lysophospholipase L1-like esterase
MIRFFRLALKISLAILVTFLVLELLLLTFNDLVFRHTFYMYNPDLGFRVRPYAQWGAYQANEFGFNDHDYPHHKEPGAYRILILSDSFNWAGGPTGNYTALLEQKFATEFGPGRVEVINAGYSRTHTAEQLAILKKFGLQYNPDLVVLGFFAGNDFFDAQPWRRRIVVGGTQVDLDTRLGREMTLLGQPLVAQSRLYLFLQEWYTTRQYKVQAQPPALEEEPVTVGVSLPTEEYLAMEYARMQVANWEQASAVQPNEEYIFDSLRAMRELLAERKIGFIVAAYPDEFQVDEALRQAVIARYEFDPTPYQWDRPQGRLWEFCTAQGIEFYDLLPTFQEAHQQGQRLYLPNDSHWNKAGNELAAQYLFEVLVWKAREYLGP